MNLSLYNTKGTTSTKLSNLSIFLRVSNESASSLDIDLPLDTLLSISTDFLSNVPSLPVNLFSTIPAGSNLTSKAIDCLLEAFIASNSNAFDLVTYSFVSGLYET